MGDTDSDDDFLADVDEAEIDDWVSDDDLDAELDAEFAKDVKAVVGVEGGGERKYSDLLVDG